MVRICVKILSMYSALYLGLPEKEQSYVIVCYRSVTAVCSVITLCVSKIGMKPDVSMYQHR